MCCGSESPRKVSAAAACSVVVLYFSALYDTRLLCLDWGEKGCVVLPTMGARLEVP